MPSIEYTRPFVYDYQKEIIDSPARFTVCEASTKIGKTASHIIWLFEQPLFMKLKAGQTVWWIAPFFGQAEIAFKRMKNQVTDRNFFKVNETKLRLTYPTGAEIHFKSAERPDNLFGEDVHAFVFDEFTRAREESWFALRTTITATKARGKFIGNVKGKHNWGYKLAQRAKSGEAEYKYFKITAYDGVKAGLLSMDEVEQAKRDYESAGRLSVFNELYLAEASEDGSNPFGYSFIEQCTYPLSTLPAVCFGVDLAKSVDWTVIIGLDKNGCVCHFERFQKDWQQTINIIKGLPMVPISIDSTGVGDPVTEQVQQSRGNVKAFKFTQFTKQQIMEGLAAAIQQRRIQFPDGHVKTELENFEFEYTRTGVRYAAPEGIHDDCVCALALAWDIHKEAVLMGNFSMSFI